MPVMRERYQAALREAEERWTEGDVPPVVEAVATATGLDPRALWDEVEGTRGWESHDTGYGYVVWCIAWELKGCPDWAADEQSRFRHRFTVIPDSGNIELHCTGHIPAAIQWPVGYHPSLDVLNEQAAAHNRAHHSDGD